MRKDIAIILCLVLAVGAVYAPAVRGGFVMYDDPGYVTENRHVRGGLGWDGAAWAFTNVERSNWHPLAWLSHMLDWQLFGPRAGGHHLTSVLLHAANAVLLFLLLRRMTAAVPARHSLGGGVWPSAVVAGLFALHPLHVESVAWVSERKDVLSTFFGLLALLAYVRYAARPGVARYVPVFALLALGLMAKPMLVTLPLVMLLLDWWPLGRYPLRIANCGLRIQTAPARGSFKSVIRNPQSAISFGRTSAVGLVLEKIPLFLLSALFSVVAYAAQQRGGAVVSTEALPLATRLAHVPIAYVEYLRRTLWPSDLAFYYPFETPAALRGGSSTWQVAAATLGLAAVTALVVWQGRRRPYLAVGWFWFVGMLVPVIGLVQVGTQAMADRYTYLPLVGLFVAVTWAAADFASGRRYGPAAAGAAASAVLIACAALAWFQVGYWHDGETLCRRAIAVAPGNSVVHDNLGRVYLDEGRLAEAAEQFSMALQINPSVGPVHNNLAKVLDAWGRADEAAHHFREALRLNPASAAMYNTNLAAVLIKQGRMDEAILCLRDAVRADPTFPGAHNNLGVLLTRQGRRDEAVAAYREAVRLDPGNPDFRANLEAALAAPPNAPPPRLETH